MIASKRFNFITMRIALFKLAKEKQDFDLAARVAFIMALGLEDRNRGKGGDSVRLEMVEQRGPLLLCDFVKIRMRQGPAKAGLNQPATGFNLAKDEGFGEETAFLWDSSNDWCVVQYNHYGVRTNTIAEYLGEFDHSDPVQLELLPKLDDEIHAKLQRKTLVKKVTIAVAAKELSAADFAAGQSLGQAAKMVSRYAPEKVEITISTRKKGGLIFSIGAFESWLTQLGAGSSDSPVESAKVTAKDTEDDKSEELDLLNGRIKQDADILPGIDKRLSVKDRFDALERMHGAWRKYIK